MTSLDKVWCIEPLGIDHLVDGENPASAVNCESNIYEQVYRYRFIAF